MTWRDTLEPDFIALDPGGVHCGTAVFKDGTCVFADEFPPNELFSILENTLTSLVVFEEFKLYPWKSKEQGFSELEVVQTIGVIKYICKRREINTVQQTARIKNVIEAQLRARKVSLVSRGNGGHAKDAELHGYYYLYKQSSKAAIKWNGRTL